MNMRVKLTVGFERFWNEYGNKQDRKTAERAWNKHRCEDIADDIIASIPAYNAHLKANPWKHKKHPATWLNGYCWENEYPESQTIHFQSQETAEQRNERLTLFNAYRFARDEGQTQRAAELKRRLDSITH
jgi:hypothetical protein